jgi:uncharacterized protein YceK
MNKLLTVVAVTAVVSGCSSVEPVGTMSFADRHQAAKTQYYEELNQRRYRDSIHATAEIDTKLERPSVEAVNGTGQ